MQILILIFLSFLSTAAQSQEKPKFKVLWDLSKGYKKSPLALYRYIGSPELTEDDYGDLSIDLTAHLRSKFPRQVSVSDLTPDTWGIVFNQGEFDEWASQGTFPDVKVDFPSEPVKGEAYLNINGWALDKVDLTSYNLLFITVATSWAAPYTASEVSAVVNYVKNGGRLVVLGENFWTPRFNVKPILNAFGFDLAMTVTSAWTKFTGPFSGLDGARSDGGAWLCRGVAAGWHFTFEQHLEVMRFGNGVYESYLADYTANYSRASQDELCNKKTYNGNEKFEAVIFSNTVEGENNFMAPMAYVGQVNRGKVLLFGDSSFLVNTVIEKSPENIHLMNRLFDLVTAEVD